MKKRNDLRKKSWTSERRKHHSEEIRRQFADGRRSRKKYSRMMKKTMARDEMKIASGLRIEKFNKTPRARRLRSESSKRNWQDKDIRFRMLSGMIDSRAKMLRGSPNRFETECYDIIDCWGMKYRRQYQIYSPFTLPDAFFPSTKTCLYFDSAYWHSKPDNRKRDNRIRKELKRLGYRVAVIRCNMRGRILNKSLDTARRITCA